MAVDEAAKVPQGKKKYILYMNFSLQIFRGRCCQDLHTQSSGAPEREREKKSKQNKILKGKKQKTLEDYKLLTLPQ